MDASPRGFARPYSPDPVPRDSVHRIERLRKLAWFLDRSIPIGRWRIGLDPILGLVPGVGDWAGAMLGLYVVYQGARLGMPANVLVRMGGNVLLEAVVGTVPVLGDVFDAAWKANTRNLDLIERHYRPSLRARPLERIWLGLLFFALVLLSVVGLLIYLVLKGLAALAN